MIFSTPWMYRGAQMLAIGLLLHLFNGVYARYLQTNRCPYCKAEVEETADLCPSCFRSLVGYQGIDAGAILGTALMLFLALAVCLMVLMPYSWAV